MDKEKLKKELVLHHTNFIEHIKSLTDTQREVSIDGKWSATQQLDHIVRSVSPVKLAFGMPAFLLKLIFGKANRKSRLYDELVVRYQEKLKAGGRASGRFIPAQKMNSMVAQYEKLTTLTYSLTSAVDSFSEEQLDQLILPHPLLGKLTLREMLYFTIYHVQHHQKQLNLNP